MSERPFMRQGVEAALELGKQDKFYNRRFRPLLVAFGLAWMAAEPYQDEMVSVANKLPRVIEKDIPRAIRSEIAGEQPELLAKKYLADHQKEIENGQPVPIDLETFYLEQERQAGVSQKEIDQAREAFDAIVSTAESLKTSGDSQGEVLGYVLKQQGKYLSGSGYMSDLLNSHIGNCEAREKFISAAFQKLYPEDAAAGKLKTESFGSYRNKDGENVVGHVRVVLDEGDRVGVLEGDSVVWETAEKHAKIPKYETTSMAVKSYAAGQGLYDFKSDQFVTEEQRETKKKNKPTDVTAHGVLLGNGTQTLPPSSARYHEERGLDDVNPTKVHGSWAPAHDTWDKAIELELRTPLQTLTPEMVPGIMDPNTGWSGLVALEGYKDIDLPTMNAILARQKEVVGQNVDFPVSIRGDQHLPPEAFKDHEGSLSLVVTSPLGLGAETLKGIPLSSLMVSFDHLPSDLSQLQWKNTVDLNVSFEHSGSFKSGGVLGSLRSTQHGSLDFFVDDDPRATPITPKIQFNAGELKNFHLELLAFDGVDYDYGPPLDTTVEDLDYSPATNMSPSFLSRIHAQTVSIDLMAHGQTGKDAALPGRVAGGLSETGYFYRTNGEVNDGLRNAIIDVRATSIDPGAFEGLPHLKGLEITTGVLSSNALTGINTDVLIIDDVYNTHVLPFTTEDSLIDGGKVGLVVLTTDYNTVITGAAKEGGMMDIPPSDKLRNWKENIIKGKADTVIVDAQDLQRYVLDHGKGVYDMTRAEWRILEKELLKTESAPPPQPDMTGP